MSYTSFSTTSLFEYLPTRYQATCEQQRNRREVYDFKDGYCFDRVYNGLKEKSPLLASGYRHAIIKPEEILTLIR